MSTEQNAIGRRSFVKTGLLATGALVAVSEEATAAGKHDEKIHMTWEAEILPGGLDAFMELAKEWEGIAEKDPKCLYSKWTMNEAKTDMRLDTLFVDVDSAASQFPVNVWHNLDVLRADKKIKYKGMVIGGKRNERFDWLLDFDIEFWVPAID